MENELSRKEHDGFHKEFAERIDAEDTRQNKRLDLLEENINHINDLTVSVEKMAVNMENMLNAIERQGDLIEKQNERISKIEEEPADNYKQIKTAIVTAVVLAVVEAAAVAIIALL